MDALASAKSFEITGSYTEKVPFASSGRPGGVPASGARGPTVPISRWTIDLVLVRPNTEHLLLSGGGVKLEAILIGADAYFRGQDYLSQNMGSDPLSRNLVKAAGNAWWKGSAANAPRLPDLTDGNTFRATFLGAAVTQRSDHVAVDGLDAVDLSGPRADVFIDASPPYRLIRVRLKDGVVVDGISAADLRFDKFDLDFGIAAPTDVIDFSNLSTLPPIYTVVSVDTSGCGSPCLVSALVKNLGGTHQAVSPSTITFSMTDTASGRALGNCQAQVKPDVGYNATTTVSCTIVSSSGPPANAATVTALAENPGHA